MRRFWIVFVAVLIVAAGIAGPRALSVSGMRVTRAEGATPSFRSPSGIAVDVGGHVYVADSTHHRIVKLSADGKVLTTWGYTRHGTDWYCDPGSVTVSPGGTVYVSRCRQPAVLQLTADLKLLARWKQSDPSGIAVDANGNVYVSHMHHPDITVFSPTGTVLRSWKRHTFGNNNAALAVDRHGNVYVADDGLATMKVQTYTPTGRLLAQWGTTGHKPGQFTSATGVAVDQHDNVYVVDAEGGRVEKFTSSGRLLAVYGNVDSAVGIAVDTHGNMFVTSDFFNSVYKLSPTGEELARWGN